MIKIDGKNQRNVRECTADFEFMEAGELRTEQIRVRYFSQTVGELKLLRGEALARFNAANKKADDKIDETDFPWVSNQLAKRLESLPDISFDGKKPIAITAENLDKISAVNLRAIEKAIEDDLVPKSQPSS